MTSKADKTIEQIDELIERDQLTTRSGLKLAFSALRDAISVVSDAGEKIIVIEKRVDTLWSFYRVATWSVTIVGGLLIGLLFSLLTGQAHITFGNP